MKLSEFRRLTEAYDPETDVMVMDYMGIIEHATIVDPEDLTEEDPVRETFPSMALVLCGEAS